MPSIPRFKTPALSQISSPKVANKSGQAILIVAAQNPALKSNSSKSNITLEFSSQNYSVSNQNEAYQNS